MIWLSSSDSLSVCAEPNWAWWLQWGQPPRQGMASFLGKLLANNSPSNLSTLPCLLGKKFFGKSLFVVFPPIYLFTQERRSVLRITLEATKLISRRNYKSLPSSGRELGVESEKGQEIAKFWYCTEFVLLPVFAAVSGESFSLATRWISWLCTYQWLSNVYWQSSITFHAIEHRRIDHTSLSISLFVISAFASTPKPCPQKIPHQLETLTNPPVNWCRQFNGYNHFGKFIIQFWLPIIKSGKTTATGLERNTF